MQRQLKQLKTNSIGIENEVDLYLELQATGHSIINKQ